MQGIIIDISDKIDCVKAEANGFNVLILRKLAGRKKRVDGKYAGYELEHRWLSKEVLTNYDENWVCVVGNDFTYWQRKEIEPVLRGVIKLCDFFQLF